MRKNYRSTHEILSWSTALLVGRPFEQLADDARNETLLGYRSALHGNGPEVFGGSSEAAELDALVTRVRGWLDDGIQPGEIGIGSRFNKSCDKAVERLTAAGIRATRLRGDAVSDSAAVPIGTMHSFKGLEFRCVAVIGVSDGALPYPRAVTPVDVDRLQHEADLLAERCLLSSPAPARGTVSTCRGGASRASSWWRRAP
ncbi:superfamily I DNA/RNA helicase [Streptomyces sp. B1I3]|nr:superfamily I DNA/RNA helicase [Streptomyces sp. B1I3]